MSDVFDFLNDDALEIRAASVKYPEGKVYRVPSPTAEAGLRLQALSDISMKQARGVKITAEDAARLKLDDEREREFMAEVLSRAVLDEMVADGVSWVRLQRLNQYAFLIFTAGQHAADEAVKNGLLTGGKVRAPLNRAQRRSEQHKRTETTPATPSRGSGDGKSQPARRRRRR